MGADRMFAMTQRPMAECKKVLETFHKNQPEIRDVFHRDITAVLQATRTLIAPNGRRHAFFDRIDKKAFNEGISFLPQAIVSDQTKFSLIPTYETCGWARLLSEQHDGTLAEVPSGREYEYASVYKHNIEKPINFQGCSLSRDFELVIPAEVEVGENWQNLEKLKV